MNKFQASYTIGWALFFGSFISTFYENEYAYLLLISAVIVFALTAFFDVLAKLEKHSEKSGYKFVFWALTTAGSLFSIVQCNHYLGNILGFTPTVASTTYAVLLAFSVVGFICMLYSLVFTVSFLVWAVSNHFRNIISIWKGSIDFDYQKSSMLIGLFFLFCIAVFFCIIQYSFADPYVHALLEYSDFHSTKNCKEAAGNPVLFIGDGKGLVPVGELPNRHYTVVDCY